MILIVCVFISFADIVAPQLAAFDAELTAHSARYVFHQRARDFVVALTALLSEKSAVMDEALLELRDLRKDAGNERAQLAAAHRRDLIAGTFGRRHSRGDRTITSGGGVYDSGSEGDAGGEPELDEFGRDLNAPRREAKERRERARMQRRAKIAARVSAAVSAATGAGAGSGSVTGSVTGSGSVAGAGSADRPSTLVSAWHDLDAPAGVSSSSSDDDEASALARRAQHQARVVT
jgi:hypothetical protein